MSGSDEESRGHERGVEGERESDEDETDGGENERGERG